MQPRGWRSLVHRRSPAPVRRFLSSTCPMPLNVTTDDTSDVMSDVLSDVMSDATPDHVMLSGATPDVMSDVISDARIDVMAGVMTVFVFCSAPEEARAAR